MIYPISWEYHHELSVSILPIFQKVQNIFLFFQGATGIGQVWAKGPKGPLLKETMQDFEAMNVRISMNIHAGWWFEPL